MNNEQISALMDDALAGPSQTTAVDQLLADPAARAAWGRYHLIGDALRDEAASPRAVTLPTANVIPLPQRQAPRRPLVGLGLAAAVAMVAVVLNALAPVHAPVNGATPGNAPVAQADPAADPDQNKVIYVRPDGTSVAVKQDGDASGDDAEQPLDGYMTNFNEQRARQGTPGVHSYVHTVGYEAR